MQEPAIAEKPPPYRHNPKWAETTHAHAEAAKNTNNAMAAVYNSPETFTGCIFTDTPGRGM